MNNEQAKAFIEGIGALSEITALFYRGLIVNGIPAKDAADLTAEFVKQITPKL